MLPTLIAQMWGSIANLRLQKASTKPSPRCTDLSDDDSSSSCSHEEGLECPICWESFNIVENVPYISMSYGVAMHFAKIVFLVFSGLSSNCLRRRFSFHFLFPAHGATSYHFGWFLEVRKNYFILWMIGSLNGERAKSELLLRGDSQQAMSPARSSLLECSSHNHSHRRVQRTHFQGWLGSNLDNSHLTGNVIVERPQFSLHKSLDYFIRLPAKFPLVLISLVIAFLLVPGLTVLVLYLLVTILLALPSILVLVFAYPTLGWLLNEITS